MFLECFLFTQFYDIAPIVVISPQEDLAKSGYTTNKEIEDLGFLFHVGEY
jgi:hypothetical protein